MNVYYKAPEEIPSPPSPILGDKKAEEVVVEPPFIPIANATSTGVGFYQVNYLLYSLIFLQKD
jgi:hypothetical protein